MQRYEIRTTKAVTIDGEAYKAEELVAVVETSAPFGDLVSGARVGHLRVDNVTNVPPPSNAAPATPDAEQSAAETVDEPPPPAAATQKRRKGSGARR